MINTVLVPAAGLGKRLHPLTFSTPKELMPIYDEPAINYLINELISSGVKKILIIISKEKNIIKNYIHELIKLDSYKFWNNIEIKFLYQDYNCGLEHSLYIAKKDIDEEYFGVALPDEIFFYYSKDDNPFTKAINLFEKEKKSIILTKKVPLKETNKYGIIKEINNKILSIIEKPSSNPPSCNAIVGRYIFSKKIFNYFSNKYDKNNEICLTKSINDFLKNDQIINLEINNIRFDIGNFKGLNLANIFFGNFHEKR